jgi:type IV pilus assembly protein PilA
VTNNGLSKTLALKSYVGVPYLDMNPSNGTIESVTIAILCESTAAGEGTEQTMNSASCPNGWISLSN